MKYIEDIDVLTLLDKPVWQLTGREFCTLTHFANTLSAGVAPTSQVNVKCEGVRALAEHLGCSESKVYELRRDGILDGAVISHIGRALIFDVDKARNLASTYIDQKQNHNHDSYE